MTGMPLKNFHHHMFNVSWTVLATSVSRWQPIPGSDPLIVSILQGVIAVTVQLFYTWRIHVLIHSWFLTIPVAFLSLGGGGRFYKYYRIISVLNISWKAASFVSTYDLSLIPAYGKFQPWDVSSLRIFFIFFFKDTISRDLSSLGLVAPASSMSL